MNHIHLYGPMAETYPKLLKFEVKNPAEAIRAISTQLPGFGDVITAGEFVLLRTINTDHARLDPEQLRECMEDDSQVISEDCLVFGLGSADLHIVQVVGGSGGGVGKAMLGVALVAGAFFTGGAALAAAGGVAGAGGAMGLTAFSVMGLSVSYGQIAIFGAAMALGGVAQMLTKPPKPTDQNFSLGPPTNVMNQGAAVPLIYGGPIRVGSVAVSSQMTTVAVTSHGGIVEAGSYGTITGTTSGRTEGLSYEDSSFATGTVRTPTYIGNGTPGG